MVYVLNKNNEPVMPCSERKARLLLKQGRAVIYRKDVFTIKLINGSYGYKQHITLGVDCGSKHIGVSATTDKQELFSANAELRNDVVKLLSDRRMLRRSRRFRKTRYRKPRFDNRRIKAFITKSYQNLFGVRSYINAKNKQKMNQVKFVKLRRDAVLPEKKTDGAAGYDLYVPDNTLIRKGRNLIKLGIAIQMPSNMKAIIKPRSGFSLKGIIGVDGKYHDADVLDGVIDCDYTGCIGVIVKSFEKEPFYIAAKERIAQLLFSNYIEVEFVEVESLDSTDRGDGGFGHTNNAGK